MRRVGFQLAFAALPYDLSQPSYGNALPNTTLPVPPVCQRLWYSFRHSFPGPRRFAVLKCVWILACSLRESSPSCVWFPVISRRFDSGYGEFMLKWTTCMVCKWWESHWWVNDERVIRVVHLLSVVQLAEALEEITVDRMIFSVNSSSTTNNNEN